MKAVKESKLGEHVTCILINIETFSRRVRMKVDRFFDAHAKDAKVIHLHGKPPQDYVVTYVPHPCAVDGAGKVLMNYKGGIDKAIICAAKVCGTHHHLLIWIRSEIDAHTSMPCLYCTKTQAAGKVVPRKLVKSSCVLV
mmetsp:Transcript_26478/g.49493  ORF Transcript_26478/g.49493 Transcript_26478/m.49493 type:complete len:139 (-) Transcript_26478:313-729(-)